MNFPAIAFLCASCLMHNIDNHSIVSTGKEAVINNQGETKTASKKVYVCHCSVDHRPPTIYIPTDDDDDVSVEDGQNPTPASTAGRTE